MSLGLDRPKDFNYTNYTKTNHLDSIEEISTYANDHHLRLRNLGINV